MKRKLISCTMAWALPVLFVIPTLAGPNPKPAQPAAPAGQGEATEAGKHPNIRDAMEQLHAAKKHLEAAPAEFGGHRDKAIEHVNAAIEECNAALKYAQEHKE
jgi:hypothetical protein